MFTGLVETVGEVAEIKPMPSGLRLRLRTDLSAGLAPGDSLAVNGVCLTVVSADQDGVHMDVSPETLRVTTLGSLKRGMPVNLERPMRADARVGGHFVQGHVDGVGGIWDVRDDGFARVVTIGAPPEIMRYVIEKGSIAVDGVSLTISGLGEDWFQVSLIPETLERTILGEANTGTPVNLEVDVLAKYIERLVPVR
jgi:riboflavin synthase